mgnify:FL=1
MDISNLWEKLEPKPCNLEAIRLDLKAGLVPNLPYFVIGNEELKKKLSDNISAIDSQFSFSYIVANYGNGKTNILRYLEYFFNEVFKERNVKVAYWRADVDKYDLIIFLLYIIQVQFNESLRNALIQMSSEEIDKAAFSYKDSFVSLKEYVSEIKSHKESSDDLNYLIELGTGRKYTKGAFQKYSIPQLSDYNRREVLVFFLNVLAVSGNYIIFAIDELEKIHEKSKARFSSFLTSYRELIDLKGTIKGHCLLTAATDASGSTLASINPAFERRISSFKLSLEVINGKANISLLASYLTDLIGSGKTNDQTVKIVNTISSKSFSNNNTILEKLCSELFEEHSSDWNDLLKSYSLQEKFLEEKDKLSANAAFEGIYTKFFDSLNRYIKVYTVNDNIYIKASERILLKHDEKEIILFMFSDDYVANINRLNNLTLIYPDYQIRVFRPLSTDMSFELKGIKIKEIVTYEPEDLMTLFDLYYDYYAEYGEEIEKIIHAYSKNIL